MDDNLICSDFCEENGHTKAAVWLRVISGGRRTAYVVMERGAEYNDEIISPKEEGAPQSIFLDRAEAERVAALRDAGWHRENNILDCCYTLKDVTSHAAPQLSAKIAEILGREFELPNEGQPTFARADGPLIEGPATDEQMLAIADLFTLKFFYVVETDFASKGDQP